ncbi:hypothetical protein [Hyphomonas sp.]|uniref:hypothetical protein n=1 Tax=Hyphomonas sp. TaxID=87 RepID=UPI003512831C
MLKTKQEAAPSTNNISPGRNGRNGGRIEAKKLDTQFTASGSNGTAEMPELRKRPIYIARALPIPYGSHQNPCSDTEANKGAQGAANKAATAAHPLDALVSETIHPPEKRTDGLPVGSQAKFIEATKCAAILGFPVNTLLTVRWSSLYYHDNTNPLFAQSPVERIAYLVELLRKWIGARCRGGFQYLWVREATSELGEHWHLAFHLPHGKRKAIASYLSDLLGEPLDHTHRTRTQGRTEGEFACSVWGSWHLAKDTHPERSGFYLAAYLGKGEPSERMFRGKLVPNTRKLVRGQAFGGRERSGRYDATQGQIRGTTALKKRFDIARPLKQAMKARQSGDLSGMRG